MPHIKEPLIKLIKQMKARRKRTKKRSLYAINEHFRVPVGRYESFATPPALLLGFIS